MRRCRVALWGMEAAALLRRYRGFMRMLADAAGVDNGADMAGRLRGAVESGTIDYVALTFLLSGGAPDDDPDVCKRPAGYEEVTYPYRVGDRHPTLEELSE